MGLVLLIILVLAILCAGIFILGDDESIGFNPAGRMLLKLFAVVSIVWFGGIVLFLYSAVSEGNLLSQKGGITEQTGQVELSMDLVDGSNNYNTNYIKAIDNKNESNINYCKNCGYKVEEKQNYCSHCGEALN